MDIPFLGSLVIALILVSSAYAFAMSLGAARGRPHLLAAARWGTIATCAFVTLGVMLLAYAFQVHDFRIVYVARYSDRSMPWWYLITSLWGGQDGSLLWWTFLLSGYTFAVTMWLRGRYLELQPYVYATLDEHRRVLRDPDALRSQPVCDLRRCRPRLMVRDSTRFCRTTGWSSTHRCSTSASLAGRCPSVLSLPVCALGRLSEEWVKAARPWAMIAWLFLSIGLLLGCLWSYEELGWGGYWAWDPVENASFMPWLVGTAYIHSAVIQERYQMLKVWNVFLMCLTFFMTIFGTFLTRSGMIASVHSFARSDIGIYFAWYLVFLLVDAAPGFIIWRLPKLRAEPQDPLAAQSRVHVPAQQLDLVGHDDLRSGRDDLAVDQRVLPWSGSHRWTRFLQQLDGALRFGASGTDRDRPACRMA